jgi:hypothetical protein
MCVLTEGIDDLQSPAEEKIMEDGRFDARECLALIEALRNELEEMKSAYLATVAQADEQRWRMASILHERSQRVAEERDRLKHENAELKTIIAELGEREIKRNLN